MYTHYGFGHHYQRITSSGQSSLTARLHTTQTAVLQASHRQFFRALTPEQREAKDQANRIEAARSRNERKVNGLIMANGAEW